MMAYVERLRERWRALSPILKILVCGVGCILLVIAAMAVFASDPREEAAQRTALEAAQAATREASYTPTPLPTPTPPPTPTPAYLSVVPLRQARYQDYRFYHFLYEVELCARWQQAAEYEMAFADWEESTEIAQSQGLDPLPPPTRPPQYDADWEHALEDHVLADIPAAVADLTAAYRAEECPEIQDLSALNGRTKWLLDWFADSDPDAGAR